MQEVEMGGQLRNIDLAGHAKAILEERPVEGLAVERDQNGAFGEPMGNLQKNGMLFVVIAHEKLLDPKPSRLPPSESDQERIRPRSPGDPGCFRVQEQPFLEINGAAEHSLASLV